MSDTPRTDEHQDAFNDNGPRFELDDVINAYELSRQLERELNDANKWKEEDPRMLREQIRVADVAFNHLHAEHKSSRIALNEWRKCSEDLAEQLRFYCDINHVNDGIPDYDANHTALTIFTKLKDQTK